MSISRHPTSFNRFVLAALPLAASLWLAPPLFAQEAQPPVPPPVPPTVTTLPVKVDVPDLPAGLLLSPCPSQPQAAGTGAAPPPGEAMTAHVPMSNGWCSRILTDEEMEIVRSILDILQPDDRTQK